jgi:hypothetical protein
MGDPYSVTEATVYECLNPSMDHILPRSVGGGDHPTNIALAHIGCNKSRRERPVDSFALPQSVREALIASGWLTESGVNDSRTHSVNNAMPSSLLEGEGEREMEKEGREDASPPPRFCPKHPNGTDKPCWACKRCREEDDARRAQAQRAAIEELEDRRRREANCPTCRGTNWIPDTDPAVKCNHQEAM